METRDTAWSTLVGTFWSPGRALITAADRRRWVLPVLAATLFSLAFGLCATQRLDYTSAADDALDASPEAAKMTQYERSQKLETAHKVGVVGTLAGSAAGPALSVLFAALGLWLGFKVAGGKPAFVPTFAVASHAMLPVALHKLLCIPALLSRPPGLAAEEAGRLLPSSLAAFLPATEKLGPRLMAASAVELFALWSLVLVAMGMAHVAQVSRARAAITSFVLWASYVAVFELAIPSFALAAK
jgi:hypothetical protein